MRLPIVAVLLALASTQVRGDIVEVSPNLYLLVRSTRGENMVDVKFSTIREASDFAQSKGGVAVPVMWRASAQGILLRVIEYQFRVMSREEALAARPTLSDAIITVDNTGTCAPNPAVTALLPDLHGIESLKGLDLLARLPPPEEEPATTAPSNDQVTPGTMCMPGMLCTPEMQCLPGMQCTPGMPPTPSTQ